MRITIIMLLLCITFDSVFAQKLDVEGSVKIADSDEATPEPGTIRWTGSDFQGWTGSKWVSLTTGTAFFGEVTDIDGNTYPTIKLGTEEWMAENLRTSRYRNGDLIPNVTDAVVWSNRGVLEQDAYCWYTNDPGFDKPFGKIYNWYTVMDTRGLCPEGWHVPSHAELMALITHIGGSAVAGGILKEAGIAHWASPNSADNSSGFTGLPGGQRNSVGSFAHLTLVGYWWSSTEYDFDDKSSWLLSLNQSDFGAANSSGNKGSGRSVRCMKN